MPSNIDRHEQDHLFGALHKATALSPPIVISAAFGVCRPYFLFYGAGISLLIGHYTKTDFAVGCQSVCKVCRWSSVPIVVFVGRIEVGKEVAEMEGEKGHVRTIRHAETRIHHKIVVVDIIVYIAECDFLTADFPSFREADVIVGSLSRPAVESSVEKNGILFNRVGKMITLQKPSNG